MANRVSGRLAGSEIRTRTRTRLAGSEGPDPYGSKALRTSLQGYQRVSIQTACNETAETPADLQKLMVWANRAGRWERIDASIQFRKSKASICREVVTKVFGLSGVQYDAIRDALDDVESGDLMGIYRHESIPDQYAIVLRLPLSSKYSNLKMSALAGAGILVGATGMWAKNKGLFGEKNPVNPMQQEWCFAYFSYILCTDKLKVLETHIKERAGIADNDHLFPKFDEESRQLFYDWFMLDASNTEQEFQSLGSKMQEKLIEPKAARLVQQCWNMSCRNGTRDEIYISRLLSQGGYGLLMTSLRDDLIKAADDIIVIWSNLEKNKGWIKEVKTVS